MIAFAKSLWRDRRGNALVLAAAALPLVLGSAGLASDTIQWALWKRELQRAADSAAMAGVYAKVDGQAVGTCSDIANATYAQPVAYNLKTNNHVGIATACTVTNPPSTGAFTADAMAVRVALSVQKKLSFSSLFLSTPPTIRATATATIVPEGKYCVISLEEDAVTGIDATGSTVVDLNCGGKTNSTSMSAAVATGSSSVKMTPVAAVGGIPASTHWGTGTVLQPFSLAQEDPFKNVPVPTPSSCNPFSSYDTGNQNKPGGTVDLSAQTGTICLKEGGSGVLDIKGNVKLGAATYVLDATSLKMTNTGAKLSCTGCTIILTSSTAATDPSSIGSVSLEGGELSIVSPTTGTYKGISIYQDRRAAADNANKINGNSSSKLEGALYFPRGDLTYNGTSGQNTACLQLVVKRVQFTGNSAITNTCTGEGGGGSFEGKRVRLVE
jgi:Flp pilus assembly protein TadG